jgi:hypothetical protein
MLMAPPRIDLQAKYCAGPELELADWDAEKANPLLAKHYPTRVVPCPGISQIFQ